MTTLYELSDKKLAALQIIDDMMADGLDDASMQEAYSLLNQLDENFNDKAVNVAMYIRNLEAEAMAIDDARKAMDARSMTLKGKANRLRNYLLSEMQRAGIKQVKCPYFVLSLRKTPPAVKIAVNAIIPVEYLHPPKPQEADKRALKDAIEKGLVIDGVTLEAGESLSIN